jgi:hypothetical protein
MYGQDQLPRFPGAAAGPGSLFCQAEGTDHQVVLNFYVIIIPNGTEAAVTPLHPGKAIGTPGPDNRPRTTRLRPDENYSCS